MGGTTTGPFTGAVTPESLNMISGGQGGGGGPPPSMDMSGIIAQRQAPQPGPQMPPVANPHQAPRPSPFGPSQGSRLPQEYFGGRASPRTSFASILGMFQRPQAGPMNLSQLLPVANRPNNTPMPRPAPTPTAPATASPQQPSGLLSRPDGSFGSSSASRSRLGGSAMSPFISG